MSFLIQKFIDLVPLKEWFLSASAIVRIGAAITTLYATLGIDGVVHGINEVEVSHIITTEDLLPKLAKVRERIPKVKTIIYVELDYKKNPIIDFGSDIDLLPFKQLEKDGRLAPKDLRGVDPTEDDIALIQYTSGKYKYLFNKRLELNSNQFILSFISN